MVLETTQTQSSSPGYKSEGSELRFGGFNYWDNSFIYWFTSLMQMILYLLIFEVLSTMFVQQEASQFLQR